MPPFALVAPHQMLGRARHALLLVAAAAVAADLAVLIHAALATNSTSLVSSTADTLFKACKNARYRSAFNFLLVTS
jgi:hypothetical protein